MKNLLFTLFALLYLNQAFAQFPLEHSYSIHGELNRRDIPGFGEKYYYVDVQAKSIVFLNADHTPWKTITPQDVAANASYFNLNQTFGANVVKTDGLLYISINASWDDANGNYVTFNAIINENGETVFNKNGVLVTLPNGQNEYVVRNEIYALPGLTLAHTYTGTDWNYFPSSSPGAPEPAYFASVDYNAQTIALNTAYNQFIRSFPIPPVTPGYSLFYVVLTDDIGDGTTDMKMVYLEADFSNNTMNIKVYKENGAQIFSEQFSSEAGYVYAFWTGANFDGLAKNKLVVYSSTNGVGSYRFYSLPGFTLEKELPFPRAYVVEPGAVKWGSNRFDETQSDITLYNPGDWSVYQIFTKPLGAVWNLSHISKYVFDNDPGFEALNIEAPNGENTPLVREMSDQSVLFQDNTLQGGFVSVLPGLANKLICYKYGAQDDPDVYNVYALPTSSPVNINEAAAQQLNVSISPNPSTSGNVFVSFEQMPETSVDVTVFNAQGILTGQVQTTANEQIAVPETCFPAQGLYFVTVRAGDWKGVAKVMRQ